MPFSESISTYSFFADFKVTKSQFRESTKSPKGFNQKSLLGLERFLLVWFMDIVRTRKWANLFKKKGTSCSKMHTHLRQDFLFFFFISRLFFIQMNNS